MTTCWHVTTAGLTPSFLRWTRPSLCSTTHAPCNLSLADCLGQGHPIQTRWFVILAVQRDTETGQTERMNGLSSATILPNFLISVPTATKERVVFWWTVFIVWNAFSACTDPSVMCYVISCKFWLIVWHGITQEKANSVLCFNGSKTSVIMIKSRFIWTASLITVHTDA